MGDPVSEWDYEEWRLRIPDGAAFTDEAQYAAALTAWQSEVFIIRLAMEGHDEQAERDLWSQGVHFTTDQVAMLSSLTRREEGDDLPTGAIIVGSVGTGKTRLVGRLVHLLRRTKTPTAYMKATVFAEELRDLAIGDSKENRMHGYRELFATAPALVIDDIGAQRSTEFTREQFTALFDERFSMAEVKPAFTLVTTNLTPEQLEAHLGERAYSRLRGLCPDIRYFDSEDLRRKDNDG